MLIAAALLTAAVQVGEPVSMEWAWADCLGRHAQSLSASPDPIDAVTDAAFTWCKETETGTKIEKRAEAAAAVLSLTPGASNDEVARQVIEAETDGWPSVVAEMRALTIAVIVKSRAQAARRPPPQP